MESCLPPLPRIPEWARWAGLPCPQEGEGFSPYVTRLGLNPEVMLNGLNGNSAHIANRRLATELMRELPEKYEEYIRQKRRAQWPPPQQGETT